MREKLPPGQATPRNPKNPEREAKERPRPRRLKGDAELPKNKSGSHPSEKQSQTGARRPEAARPRRS